MAKSKSLVGVKVPAIAATSPAAPAATAAAVYARFQSDFEVKKKDTPETKTFSVIATADIGTPVPGLTFKLTKPAELFSLGDFVDFMNVSLGMPVTRENFALLPDAKGLLGLNLTVTDFLIDTRKDAKPHFKAGVKVANEKEPWNPIAALKLKSVALVISDQPIPDDPPPTEGE